MKILRLIPLLLLIFGCPAVQAEPVVVVDIRNPIERMTHEEVINIYMGRYRRLGSGAPATPIDQSDPAIRADFYRRLVNKNPSEINAYWSRLVFSGKATPPESAATGKDVARILGNSSGMVAYLDRAEVTNRMRIVFEFAP